MFRFKQFTVRQSGSAMKVGTDGVLLGAWFAMEQRPLRVLDIGTGTGLIALMAAQRNARAMIDAVEVDVQSVVQARENFAESSWGDRLMLYGVAIQEFACTAGHRYDLIVSNPPFFTNSLECPDSKRTLARHDGALPTDELMCSVAELLAVGGAFSVILPTVQCGRAVECAAAVGLHLSCQCDVYSTINSAHPKRVMLEFRREQLAVISRQHMVIELDRRGEYSDEYRRLTADFYLKF